MDARGATLAARIRCCPRSLLISVSTRFYHLQNICVGLDDSTGVVGSAVEETPRKDKAVNLQSLTREENTSSEGSYHPQTHPNHLLRR